MARKPPPQRWKPGQSGNPKGRPPGIPSWSAKVRAGIDVQGIIDALGVKALQGNTRAAELLLDRALPALRPVAQAVELPGVAEAPNLTARADRVVQLVAAGQISADIGTSLLGALGQFARIAELDELARRVEQLEQSHALNKAD